MNRSILFLTGIFIIACQEVSESPRQISEVQSVAFRLTPFEDDDPLSKTTYEATSNGYVFYWAEGDAVGIISPEGSQLKFPILPEFYGQQYADFDGRGFLLQANTRYASYYPFIPDFDLNPSAVPVSYIGQQSVGDNDVSHLGDYSFSVAKGNSPAAGKLEFVFLNVGSPHRYRLPAISGDYTSLSLKIGNNKFVLRGTVDLLSETDSELIMINPSELSDTMSLDLQGTSLNAPGPLRCWMMMPPVNLDGEVIGLTLTLADGSEIVASVAGKDCPANSRRVFNAFTSIYPAESSVGSDGGEVQVKLIRTAETDAVTLSVDNDWLSQTSSSTEGLVTVYTFTVAANSGAEREGSISFTETSTGLTNTVKVIQQKAGTVIGIGGWDSDSYSGKAN